MERGECEVNPEREGAGIPNGIRCRPGRIHTGEGPAGWITRVKKKKI